MAFRKGMTHFTVFPAVASSLPRTYAVSESYLMTTS